MKNSVITRTILLLLFIIVSINTKAQTLAEKIANRQQLTNLATVYFDIPDAYGKNINDVLFKDRATNTADYHQTTIQVVENGCNDGTGRPLGNFTEAGLEIKVRGNSTAEMDKRPYRLRFYKDEKDAAGNVTASHKHDMLGYGYEKRNWTILNNLRDGSLMQNAITYYIGKAVGMPFCPGYKFVDLVINNEYRGNYMLSDHVEVGNHRIEVDENTGWFVESTRNDMVEEPYFNDAALYVLIKSPESKTAEGTAAIKEMIRQYFINNNNNFFGIWTNACDDATFCDPIRGWRSVFDEESLVRFYVGLELTGDSDGMMQVKMYREEDGKMQFGPLWDKDLAFGVQDDGKTLAEGNSLEYGAPTFNNYIKKIMKTDPVFVKRVHDKLHEVIDNGYINNMMAEIDKIEASLKESKKLEYNNTGWKAVSVENYPVAVERLRQYIKDHTAWLVDFIDERYESMGGDNIQEPTPNPGGEGGEDGGGTNQGPEYNVEYNSGIVFNDWSMKNLLPSLFLKNATSADIKLKGAVYAVISKSSDKNDHSAYIKEFSWSDNNKAGITFTLVGENLALAKQGRIYVGTNQDESIVLTVTNYGTPEEPTCTNHAYNEGHYVSNGNGTYSLACDKCGEKQPNSPAYYKYTIYAESNTAETVYNTSKAWRPENGKPNTLIYVEDASGISGKNVVQSTAATCSDFVLTDGHPFYNPAKFAAEKVTYTRNMNATSNWGTVCLPFKIVSGDDVTVYHLTDSNTDGNGNGTMVFTEATSGTGGLTPLIYKKNHKDATTVLFTGGEQKDHTFTVKAHKAYTENTSLTVPANWAMYGNVLEPVTISTSTTTNPAVYYIAGDKFWHATGNLAINPFRAYFEYSYATGAKPATFSISEDNEETGLNSIIDEKRTLAVFLREGGISVVAPKNMDVTIYSANGSAVSHIKAEANNEYDVNLPKGVYVVNGVKFVVK